MFEEAKRFIQKQNFSIKQRHKMLIVPVLLILQPA